MLNDNIKFGLPAIPGFDKILENTIVFNFLEDGFVGMLILFSTALLLCDNKIINNKLTECLSVLLAFVTNENGKSNASV